MHHETVETVDVESYGGCKKWVYVCVRANRTADVQTSKSVKEVYLIVKDTFNYNSRGFLCGRGCVGV